MDEVVEKYHPQSISFVSKKLKVSLENRNADT